MEDLLNILIKLAVIFTGCGFSSLLAYWAAREAKSIPTLILESEQKFDKGKILFTKKEKVSSESGFYEIFIPGNSKNRGLRIFSCHRGMKILTK